jgi:hypothetical protein
MDYRKILIGMGQSIGIVILLVLFIVLLTLLMMAFGPHATPTQELVCRTVEGVAVCHV